MKIARTILGLTLIPFTVFAQRLNPSCVMGLLDRGYSIDNGYVRRACSGKYDTDLLLKLVNRGFSVESGYTLEACSGKYDSSCVMELVKRGNSLESGSIFSICLK